MIRDFLGVLARLALTGGPGSPERIVDAMQGIPPEAITADVQEVWAEMLQAAEAGQRPTIPMLRKVITGKDDAYWQSFSPSSPDLLTSRATLLTWTWRARMARTSGEINRMLADPSIPPEKVRDFMFSEAERPMVGGMSAVDASSIDVIGYMDDLKAGKVPMIQTPFPKINKALGGGLYTRGERAVTAVLGFTGAGKSQLSKQIILHALFRNPVQHRVLLCLGEASRADALRELARIHAFVSKSQVEEYSDATRVKLKKAQDELHAKPLYIYDDRLDVDTLRSQISEYSSRLAEDVARGHADPAACLLVVVDNLDHVVKLGTDKGWALIDAAAESIMQTTKRLPNVHTIMLCQATDSAFVIGEPPGLNGFSRAKLIGSHCGNVWGLYRPTTPDMLSNPKLSQAKFLLSKARGADTAYLHVHADDELGIWH